VSLRMDRLTRSEAAVTQKDRPKTEDILKTLADVVALYEQGLIVHRASLTQSGQRHVGETFSQARAILAKSRGWQP